eukprot:jgi/Pico_ML_1/51144/g2226.t1
MKAVDRASRYADHERACAVLSESTRAEHAMDDGLFGSRGELFDDDDGWLDSEVGGEFDSSTLDPDAFIAQMREALGFEGPSESDASDSEGGLPGPVSNFAGLFDIAVPGPEVDPSEDPSDAQAMDVPSLHFHPSCAFWSTYSATSCTSWL